MTVPRPHAPSYPEAPPGQDLAVSILRIIGLGLACMLLQLCAREAFATQYLGQRVQFRLSGERTSLGFRISHYKHLPASRVPLP